MKQSDAMTKNQLEAQFIISEIRDRALRWRIAEGRFGWRIVLASLMPVVAIIIGVVIRVEERGLSGLMGEDPSSYFIILGLLLLVVTLWGNTQRQISALRSLLKDLERGRS